MDTETSTVEECLSARSKYSPSSTSTTEGILGVTGTLNTMHKALGILYEESIAYDSHQMRQRRH